MIHRNVEGLMIGACVVLFGGLVGALVYKSDRDGHCAQWEDRDRKDTVCVSDVYGQRCYRYENVVIRDHVCTRYDDE